MNTKELPGLSFYTLFEVLTEESMYIDTLNYWYRKLEIMRERKGKESFWDKDSIVSTGPEGEIWINCRSGRLRLFDPGDVQRK